MSKVTIVNSTNVLPQSHMVRVLADIPVTVADICNVPGWDVNISVKPVLERVRINLKVEIASPMARARHSHFRKKSVA